MLSTNIKTTNKDEHQKIWELLPWYVNHSLDPAEQDTVKKHIKTCIACRLELNQQQQLLDKMQQTDLLQQVSQVSFAQLKKRIEENHRPYILTQQNKSQKEGKLFSHQLFSVVKFTALAASLVLMALPFISDLLIEESNLTGEYRTLANPIQGEQKSNIIRIVFTERLSAEQVATVLSDVSGHIVKGPSQNGVYEIQIGNQQTDFQQVKEAISHLRNNKFVIFAELAHGLPVAD